MASAQLATSSNDAKSSKFADRTVTGYEYVASYFTPAREYRIFSVLRISLGCACIFCGVVVGVVVLCFSQTLALLTNELKYYYYYSSVTRPGHPVLSSLEFLDRWKLYY